MGVSNSFKEFETKFRNFTKDISQQLSLQQKKDGIYYRGVARRNAPVDTGKLVQGIVLAQIKNSDDDKSYAVVSKRPAGARSAYNVFQEMGVKPINEWHYVPGKGMVKGGSHPGFKAKEFMINTYLLMAKKIPTKSAKTVRKAVYKAFG